MSMGSSSVITPEDVLASLMNDGTIDNLRLKIINELKANFVMRHVDSIHASAYSGCNITRSNITNKEGVKDSQEELKSTTIKMAEQSKVLNTPGAEKQTKRELFDALRQELEVPALEKASKSVWDIILDNTGLGREISETVERVFCRLSGQELPLFPLASGYPDKETHNKNGKGKEKEIENENLNSSLISKKRNFSEMNSEGLDEAVTNSSDSAAALEGSSKSPLPVLKA